MGNVAFLANLMESGVDFIACDQPDANRLTVHILAAVAAYKARGGQLGTDNLTDEGRAKGARAGALAVRERAREAYGDVVPLIRELCEAGWTQQAIAARLNAEGHTTRTVRPWGQDEVKRVMDRNGIGRKAGRGPAGV